jgi:hypothetical protein
MKKKLALLDIHATIHMHIYYIHVCLYAMTGMTVLTICSPQCIKLPCEGKHACLDAFIHTYRHSFSICN